MLLATVNSCLPAAAQTPTPPVLDGWTTSADRSGIQLSGSAVTFSSPAIAEIDGNSSNGKEVAVGGADGVLYVYSASGTLLWSQTLPNAACPGSRSNKLLSSPAVGALFGDSVPYVIVGYGGIGRSCDGGVAAFRGTDGTRTWLFSLKRFSKKQKFWAFSYSVFSSPVLGDTDGDGKLEIGFGAFDRNVYLLNADGSVRWYYNAADTIWSSGAFANIDSDPDLEFIIGTDISANSKIDPPTTNGGYVYAFKTKARRPSKISFRQSDAYVWQTSFDQVIYSSPIVADVLPDSPGEEVIVGSGCFFPQGNANKTGKWLKVLRASDGKVMQTLPTSACLSSSAAVGDIDNDGILEVVATVNGHRSVGGDGLSHLIAWKASEPTPLWDITPFGRGRNDPYGGNFQSPTIADVDGNGSLEVVVSNSSVVGIFQGSDGSALTCQESSCDDLSVLAAGGALKNSPAIGDLNGDGALEIVAAGSYGKRSKGGLYAWTGLETVLSSEPGIYPSYSSPWPMFRGSNFSGH